jgi:poly-beta-hydroxyalkanoate depolymerase
MLYQLYETQRAMMAPFAEFASASSKLYNHPLSPFTHTPMAQRVSAGFDLMHRLAKEYEKPQFDIRSAIVDGVAVAVQEQVAINKPFCPSRQVSISPFKVEIVSLVSIMFVPLVRCDPDDVRRGETARPRRNDSAATPAAGPRSFAPRARAR